MEPGGEFGLPAKLVQGSIGRDKNLLGQIFGLLWLADPLEDKTEDPVPVSIHQEREALDPAGKNFSYDFFICHDSWLYH